VVVEVESASEPVWHGRSTYLAKGIQSTPTGPDAVADRAAPSGPERGTEDLPGHPTRQWSLGGDTGRRYAAVSGDYNPIHLSAASARASGMKRPIAHGMYLASRMIAEVGPGELSAFRWSVEFRAHVALPSRLFLSTDVDRSPTAQWSAAEVIAWDPRRRRTHFSGRLERLVGTGTE
jgi:acyl dehydratase